MPFSMAIIMCRFTYIEPSAVGVNTMYLRDMIRHGLAVTILNSANLAIAGYKY